VGGRPEVSKTGPGPGAGHDRDPERATVLHARIAIVATIVVGQLWGLTVALNRYFEHESVAALLAFQSLSFLVALMVWLAQPGER
jgi:cytochrome c oxidase assembly factor CtaG